MTDGNHAREPLPVDDENGFLRVGQLPPVATMVPLRVYGGAPLRVGDFGFKLVFQGPELRAVGHGVDASHHVEQSCQGDSHSTVWCGGIAFRKKFPP